MPWSTPGHLHSLFIVEVVFINYLEDKRQKNMSDSMVNKLSTAKN